MNALSFLLVCICIAVSDAIPIATHDPDILLNVSQLITSKGYPVEDHHVQTEDGYILSMQRISHGRNEHFMTSPTADPSKKVVFILHGLLSASSDWVINFPEESLGFMLADAGYDVWLGNVRGNTYSKKHVKYTPHDKEFWNYSFDEMAKYDIPAMVDYVLNVTKKESLFYIGHSQGTTSAFALLSENPVYNKKIELFVAMAPVTTVGYITSAIRYLAPFTSEVEFLFDILGVRDFLPSNAVMKFLSEYVCDSSEKFLCEDIMFLMFGSDSKQLNQTRIGVYTAHTPAGSSSKSVVHYAQLVKSKSFVKYDYGKSGNMAHYGQPDPPEYNVSRITTPVALLWSLNDDLADPADVGLLKQKLKSIVADYCVPFPQFNHGDFAIAMEANRLVYDEILKLFKKYVEN